MFCNQSKNEVKKKKQCCFSEKIWTETLIPSFPSCPILFPYALKKNGGEGSELFIILVPRMKINGWQSVEVLCNFLNFWIGIEWMGKLLRTLFLSTSLSLPLDFCIWSACSLQEPGDWIIAGSPQVWWLHFLGYIKSKLPNKLSAGSVYHIAIEQLECTETWPGWKNNYVKHWR